MGIIYIIYNFFAKEKREIFDLSTPEGWTIGMILIYLDALLLSLILILLP